MITLIFMHLWFVYQHFHQLVLCSSAHTTNPSNPVAIVAKIIPRFLNASFFPVSWQIICEIIPKPGRMRM